MYSSTEGLLIKVSCFWVIVFTVGNNNWAIVIASKEATKQVITDSTRNWFIKDVLDAPATLRIPTSFAFIDAFAVARFT